MVFRKVLKHHFIGALKSESAFHEFRQPICPKKSSKFASYQLHPLHLHHT